MWSPRKQGNLRNKEEIRTELEKYGTERVVLA